MRMTARTLFPITTGAILAATLVVSGVVTSNNQHQLASQREHLDALTTQIEEAAASTNELETAASLAGKGANLERVASDTEIIRALVKGAMTWDSHDSYTSAREKIMAAYGLNDADSFIQSFLPEAPVNRDSEGNEYPYIDAAGLNSRVGDISVSVLNVDGADYSYMALVDVQSTSSDGLGAAVNVATVLIDIAGDGEVLDVSGFASTTTPATSG